MPVAIAALTTVSGFYRKDGAAMLDWWKRRQARLEQHPVAQEYLKVIAANPDKYHHPIMWDFIVWQANREQRELERPGGPRTQAHFYKIRMRAFYIASLGWLLAVFLVGFFVLFKFPLNHMFHGVAGPGDISIVRFGGTILFSVIVLTMIPVSVVFWARKKQYYAPQDPDNPAPPSPYKPWNEAE